jgi:hypothetical protein
MKIVGTKLVMADGWSIDMKAVFYQNYIYDPGFRPAWEPGNTTYFPGSRVASAADMAYRTSIKARLGPYWLVAYIPELGDNWRKIIDFVDSNGATWVEEIKKQFPILKTNLRISGAALDKLAKKAAKGKG